jgi:hypothetical protein
VESGKVAGCVSAVSFATLYYLARRLHGHARAHAACETVQRVFAVASVDADVVKAALSRGMQDFEDALQAFSGVRAGETHVVTRDADGFRGGPLPVLTPEQSLSQLQGP